MHIQHTTVYKVPGRYAGWPANYGIWNWGDEIVTGFTLGHHDIAGGFHARDRDQPIVTFQSRSLDGGETWSNIEAPLLAPGGEGISADEHMNNPKWPLAGRINPPGPHPGDTDFTHPDFAMLCARTGLVTGAESYFYTSTDRCQSWEGPFTLPMFGELGIAARTDYLIDGSQSATLLLSSTKPDGEEGRVFCARTENGGRSFKFVSWLREEPEGFDIMPASVRVDRGGILTALRTRGAEGDADAIDLMRSDDNGQTWRQISTPTSDTGTGGNPPAMIQLSDGRICLTYGYRDAPSGMRAVLSDDDGESWGAEIVLRDDGGSHDIGYPRSVQRSDGSVVTVYYYTDSPDGDRYIAATIWKP
jgi:hypothetical protein